MTTIEMYSFCDICGKPLRNNGITFERRVVVDNREVCEYYALCDEHLPDTPRVRIWKAQQRCGREQATQLGLGINYGGCEKCGTPWDCIKAHTTMTSESRGCFPLCQPCWSELSPEERLPFYRALWQRWVDQGYPLNSEGESWEECWRKIETAVLAGK